jgi:hypothetical protein
LHKEIPSDLQSLGVFSFVGCLKNITHQQLTSTPKTMCRKLNRALIGEREVLTVQRIRRQRETFCYRIAADAVGTGDNKKKKTSDPFSPFDTKQDLNAQREGWNPDKYNNVPEPTGPRMDKMVVTQGMGLPGQSGGSNTARPGGGSVGAGGIMDVSRPLVDLIKQKYPNVEIGGYREDWAGEHAKGAIDIMHPYNHGIDPNWAIQEGFKAGAPWSIWDNQMHYPDGSTKPYNAPADNPTQRHEDHIHIGPLSN